MDTLGDRLRELREDNRMQQKELAIILNVHTGSISNWETNKRTPSKEILIKIADYFNVSIDYLFAYSDNQKKFDINFGEKLKKLRTEKNMTQEELANKIGITDAALSRYENNKREPKVEILWRISKIFNVSIDYFLDNNFYEIDLSKTEINILIEKLRNIGFNIDKLIFDIKNN